MNKPVVDTVDIQFARPTPEPQGNAGITAEQHAQQRMQTLIEELNGGGRRVCTNARDKIDDLLTALDRRGAQLVEEVNEYAGLVQQSVEMAGVIMEPIDNLARTIGAAVSPPPGRTLTQA